MASYQKFQQFAEDVAHGVHDLGSDTLKGYLTNATPDPAADAVKADLAEIGAGNGYSAGGVTLTVSASAHTSGTYKLTIADGTITASGGSIGPFRYFVVYNDTPVSPADPLIAFFDYGSAITLLDGEELALDFDGTNGLLTLA